MSRRAPGLTILYVNTFTMAAGFYLLMPLLAYHFLNNLALSIAVTGALAAVRSAAQQGLQPITGWLADRLDYHRAISAGVLLRAVGFILLGTLESIPGLTMASILAGLGGALFHPASYAAYSALAEGQDSTRIYSMRELLSNAGFVVGPLVGSWLAAFDFRWVTSGAATLFIVTFFLTILWLPRGLSRGSGERGPARFTRAFRDRHFLAFLVCSAGMWILLSQLYLVVPIRATDVLPGVVGMGVVYSVAAVFMVITMIPINALAQRLAGHGSILAFGTVFLGVGIAVTGLWDSMAGLVAGVLLFTLGQILTQPTMNAVVAERAPDGVVASYFGALGLAHAFGGVIGNTLGGLLYSLADRGVDGVWFVFPGVAAVVAAAFMRLIGEGGRGW